MFCIAINGSKVLKINEEVSKDTIIKTLTIVNTDGPKLVPKEIANIFSKWVYDLVQCTEKSIMYNGKLIDKKHVYPYIG